MIKMFIITKIVANGFTGIDVDKMDYFARDSHSVGLPNSFDWRYNEFNFMHLKCCQTLYSNSQNHKV